VAINNALPIKVAHDDGNVAYFQFHINLLLPKSLVKALSIIRLHLTFTKLQQTPGSFSEFSVPQ